MNVKEEVESDHLPIELIVTSHEAEVFTGFRKGGYFSRQDAWFYEGNTIEAVNSYCYLGFTFTTMSSAKLGTIHLAAKGNYAVYLLCKAIQKCKMTQHTFCTILCQCKVQPILVYSPDMWGLHIWKECKKYVC